MNFPFFRLKPDQIDELAALRDRALVAETKVVLLEDIVQHRVPKRDPAGRFASTKPDTKAMLTRLFKDLTAKEREAAKVRALSRAKALAEGKGVRR